MEYVNLIKNIIDAEAQAQELARESRTKRDSLNADLPAEMDAIRRQMREEADHRIALAREADLQWKTDEIASLNRQLEASLAAVEAAYRQNADAWVDKLFARVTGVSQ